jgi:hypothetical protein
MGRLQALMTRVQPTFKSLENSPGSPRPEALTAGYPCARR